MSKTTLLIISSALIVLTMLSCAQQASASDGSLNLSWALLDNFVRPGGETTLIISIQNTTGATIYDVDLSFETGLGLTPAPSEFSLNNISAMTYQSTSFKIVAGENAPSGTSYLGITVRYHVGSIRAEEEELKVWVPVIVRSVPLLKVEKLEYDPATIKPGSEVVVSFEVRNYGDGPAKDLVVSLDQTAGLFSTDLSEKYVGDVPVNGSARISFNLSINQELNVGTYSIPILLTYLDETKKQVFSGRELAGLRVYGDINLITTLNTQDKVAGGTSGSMEIKIANAGTMEVQFLQLRVLDSTVIEDIAPVTIYIGSLKSDDYDIEKISFRVSGNVSRGSYPINLELVYRDPFGKEFTETKAVYLNVLSKEEIGNNVGIPAWLLAVITLLAVIVLYYFLRKRRK